MGAKNVKFGGYTLGSDILQLASWSERVTLSPGSPQLKGSSSSSGGSGGDASSAVAVRSLGLEPDARGALSSRGVGKRGEGEVGDISVTFSHVPAARASVVGMVKKGRLEPFMTSSGRTVQLLQRGQHSALAMFRKAQSDNEWLTWLVRGLALVICFIAINLVLSPLVSITGMVPLFGGLLSVSTPPPFSQHDFR